ncbi:serine/threonine protein kinase [Luteolibacter sp. Populi]|uniref:serine/threonine protein kinase n=1 Tax=Luteolibacter sp. Populi TaxID=3230487 RepID=UPI00346742B7
MEPSVDKLLFIAASAFVSPADRRAFLEFACHGDKGLCDLIEELLEIDRDAEEFFEFPPAAASPALPGSDGGEEGSVGARIGPYRLMDRLGAGGCGVVYLAEQQEPVKRKVALKIIRLGMDTENVIARFNIERAALALMDHPNIARVLDAGATASGRPYFVMELVDGEKITEFCDRKRLGLRQRLELFILVCEAIQHAHQKGVIHRDIKPSNVLVREHDGRTVPKVIDFGIAKATAGDLDAEGTVTNPGQFIGTPAYMSPEQAAGGVDIDTRSDIYSLGTLLCELLTGRTPLTPEHLNDRGVEEIRTLVRDGETGVPSVRLRGIPADEMTVIANQRGVEPQRLPALLAGDLDWIVMKAMEKERHRRYGTANGLAMDVQRFLREEAVLARPPSRRYLLTKLVRRNRITFAAGSIALFGLLGGLGLSTWLFVREKAAREEQARLRVVAEEARASEVSLLEDAKVVDRVAQAAVLLRYSNMESAADELLAGVSAEKVPRSLEAANTFRTMANWNLGREQWRAAAERFNSLGHVLTSVDISADREGISFDMLSVATAVSEWGEPEEYERLRTLMLERFGNSANPIVAEHVIKATLLKPATQEILEGLRPLATVIQGSFSEPRTETEHLIAWRHFSLALMAFREGRLKNRESRLEDAAAWARSSLAMATNSEPRTVSNRLILAMIDLEQGRTAHARATLEELRGEVDDWFELPFQVINRDGTLWYNQRAVLILLREAEKMLAEKGS